MLKYAGSVAGSAGLANSVWASGHPHANAGSLGYLDRKMYIRNMTVLSHFHPPNSEIRGFHRTGQKAQMMVKGEQRFMFQVGRVYDVSNPLNPQMVNERAFFGGQLQLAYNENIDKWILMTGAGTPPASATEDNHHGKYDSPEKVKRVRGVRGLRSG